MHEGSSPPPPRTDNPSSGGAHIQSPPRQPAHRSLIATDSPHWVRVELLGELKFQVLSRAVQTGTIRKMGKAALRVLVALLDRVDDVESDASGRMISVASRRDIKQRTGLGVASIRRAVKLLHDQEFVKVLRSGTGHQTSVFELAQPPHPQLSGGITGDPPGGRALIPPARAPRSPRRAPHDPPGVPPGTRRGDQRRSPPLGESLYDSVVVVKDSNEVDECAALLRKIGFKSETQIAKIIDSPNCTLKQIDLVKQLWKAQSPGTIKNKLGWIRSAIVDGYAPPASPEERRRESLPEHLQELNAAERQRDAAARADEARQLERLRDMSDADLGAAMTAAIAGQQHDWVREIWRRISPEELRAGSHPALRAAVLGKVGRST